MERKDILSFLDKYDFDKEKFIIISGAALVILGIKEETNDIDIAVSDDLYDELVSNYDCQFEKEICGYQVWFIDKIINFSKHYYDDLEYVYYDGYKVQSLDSILKIKQKLNREKDKKDVEKIKKYLKKEKSLGCQ